MALTTRSLTNVGDALVDPNGGVLSGAVVTFQLCQPGGRPTDAWDATTGERIGGLKTTTTNGSGEFTIALWPNDRGNVRTQYRCTVQWKNYFRDFYGSLPSGSGSYQWVDFFALGEALTPAGISALYDHITDTTVHLSAAQNTFLDALNLPTLTAAEVNYLVGVTSAVQTQLDARALASRLLIAAGGLVGGGNLTNDRAFSVGANADGSIIVNTDDIQVGVLATDAQHGVRGGGTQHANAVAAGAAGFMTGADKTKLDGVTAGAAVASVSGTAPIVSSGGTTPAISITAASGGAAGSMSAADKTKLDGITAGAAVVSVGANAPITSTGGSNPVISIDGATGSTTGSVILSTTTPAAVGTAAVGVGTTVARADHVHAHGNQLGGALHANAVNGGAAGFMTGADKGRLDTMPRGSYESETITATKNDWSPSHWIDYSGDGIGSQYYYLDADAAHDITGLLSPNGSPARKTFINLSIYNLTFKNANAGSAAPSRFDMGADVVLAPKTCAEFIYVPGVNRWYLLSKSF